MSRKREREHTLMQSLPGLTRTLRILHYTKDRIPASHRSETGGIEGLLIFNEGQNTYSNQHTDFMRILLLACNFPNVWNYTRKGSSQELAIPIWHAGHVLPIYTDPIQYSRSQTGSRLSPRTTRTAWVSR